MGLREEFQKLRRAEKGSHKTLAGANPATQAHIRVNDGSQAMRDGDRGEVPAQGLIQGVQGRLLHSIISHLKPHLHQPLRLVGQGGGRLLHQQHLGLLGQCPCDGHALPLATR